MKKIETNSKEKKKKRIRIKVRGTDIRPRLSVFRSNKYIYAQIISDEKGETLVEASEKEIKSVPSKKTTKIERAKEVGEILAQKSLLKKIKAVSFDRGGYKYQGRVKALAEGAREKGLFF